MSRPICFFLGTADSFNVRRLVSNLGWMLGNHYTLHLVSTASATLQRATDGQYEVFGDDSGSYRRAVRHLAAYLRSENPAALVQVTDPPVDGTVVGALGSRHDVPTVYRYAGDRFYEYRVTRGTDRLSALALGSILGRVPLRLADSFVTLGPAGRRRLIARGVPGDRIEVLPPSIDASRFEDADPVGLDVPSERAIALFVGRLSRLKGLETLERTIPAVFQDRPDIHFVLVGTTKRLPQVPPQYRDHVTVTGAVDPEQIPGFMAAADVLVHPSLTEGVPRVLLEALATDTPVVARNVGDVASVTANTFETDAEFAELVCSHEGVPLDPVEPFTRESLAPRYREFFAQFR